MGRWLVPVLGARFDTEELPSRFPDGEVFAIEEAGKVYLTGPAFESLDDGTAVIRKAGRVLDVFAAIIALDMRNFEKPRLETRAIRENDDGTRHEHYVVFAPPGSIRLKGHAAVVLNGQPQAQGSDGPQFLRIVTERPRLNEALSLCGDANSSWANLYRALEEIELDIGQRVNVADLCSKKARQEFARTANSAEAAGRDSRHARGKHTPPSEPMSLSEARVFVRRILQKVLRQLIARPN